MPDEPLTASLRIRALAHGGEGVGVAAEGELAGPVWFVGGVLPGELVVARAEHTAARFVRAQLERVLEPSPERVLPPCELAGICGGCNWLHVAVAAQPRLKGEIVAAELRKRLRLDRVPVQLVRSERALAYRRRVRLLYRKRGETLDLGFRRARTHDPVDVLHCPLLEPPANHAIATIRSLADVLPGEGEALVLSDGRVAIVGLPGVRPTPALQERLQAALGDVVVGIAVRGGRQRMHVGRSTLALDAEHDLEPLRASVFDFTQAQSAQNKRLVRHVQRAVGTHAARVLELYAGAGNFTRALAREGRTLWAVDDNDEAIERLARWAKAAPGQVRTSSRPAERVLGTWANRGRRAEVVVLDPPRRGLGREGSGELAAVAEACIVYVSCDPATLVRDLEVLLKRGFAIVDLTVFDMMPMTSEVEVVATLARKRQTS